MHGEFAQEAAVERPEGPGVGGCHGCEAGFGVGLLFGVLARWTECLRVELMEEAKWGGECVK